MKKKGKTKPTTSKAKKPPVRPTQAAEATRSLTIRQKRSCDIYHAMKKPNKTKACRLAGFTMGGKHAKTEAQKTFNLPHVKAYLDSLKEAATERAQKTADEIIAELEKVGFKRGWGEKAKVRALELLGRRYNLFPNRQEFHLSGEVILKPPMVK